MSLLLLLGGARVPLAPLPQRMGVSVSDATLRAAMQPATPVADAAPVSPIARVQPATPGATPTAATPTARVSRGNRSWT